MFNNIRHIIVDYKANQSKRPLSVRYDIAGKCESNFIPTWGGQTSCSCKIQKDEHGNYSSDKNKVVFDCTTYHRPRGKGCGSFKNDNCYNENVKLDFSNCTKWDDGTYHLRYNMNIQNGEDIGKMTCDNPPPATETEGM